MSEKWDVTKSLLWGIGLLLFLTACSETEVKEPYTIEDAEDDGHVVVEHLAEQFNQITDGAIELDGVGKMNRFIKKVEEGTEDKVYISIFNPNGSHYLNSLSYDGDNIQFTNNYGAYPSSPLGTFNCGHISQRGPMVYVSDCESEEGKYLSTILSFVGTEKAFRDAQK